MRQQDHTTPGRTVAYTCLYVPAEWIAAHGLTPCRVTPSAPADHPYPGMGVCPYAAAVAHASAPARAIVYTTACDQMRRMPEMPQPRDEVTPFLMHAPATWTQSALRYYRTELARLGSFLTSLGGAYQGHDRLRAIMLQYEARRAPLRQSVPAGATGPALALVGGPLLRQQHHLIDAIRSTGAHLACDATETGRLAIPPPPDSRLLQADPAQALAAAYFAIPHPARRPDAPFHTWLSARLQDANVRGLVGVYQPWCDIWHAQMETIRERTGLPMVVVGGDTGEPGAALRATSRIHALVESINGH